MWKSAVFVFSVLCCLASSDLCPENQQLDITEGSFVDETTIQYNGVLFSGDEWFRRNLSIFSCPCLKRTCLWKCCGAHEAYMNSSSSCGDTDSVFNPPVFERTKQINRSASERFFYMYNKLCEDKFLLDPAEDEGLYLYLQLDGSLLEVNPLGSDIHPATRFCLDQMFDEAVSRLVAVACFSEQTVDADDSTLLHAAYGVGLLLSVPFLVATFLVYAVVPELRNLHGQCLMAYCAGLIVAYSLLAYLKFTTREDDRLETGCVLIAFAVYYAFQTSFFWLNVMCFDIWRTFRSVGSLQGSKRGYRGSVQPGTTRRFLLYGIYAWGVPAALLAVVAAMQFVDNLPQTLIRPNFGNKKCWFDSWLSEMAYFYSPVFVLMLCNSILFVVTAIRIRSIRQETAILKGAESSRNDRLNRDKQRYGLYLKLFMVMGINWTIELVTSIVGGSNWYWMVLDVSILALGFFIFMIFVWKDKVWKLLKRRVRSIRGAKVPGDSSMGRWGTTTAATEDTRVSRDADEVVRLKDLN